jgi:uncharacterized cupin superfamily protein
MTKTPCPVALDAASVEKRPASATPEPYASKLPGREKRILGDRFGLTGFGVNHARLSPGAASSFRHSHTTEDEFVYILEGEPTLITDRGETQLKPGMCAGFKAGTGDAHHLVNRTQADVAYLEIGERRADDRCDYPDDDLKLEAQPDGTTLILHKDGTPY